MKDMMLGIRPKIVAGVIILVILPMLSVQWLLHRASQQELIDSAGRRLLLRASHIKQQAGDYLDNIRELTHSLASVEEIRLASAMLAIDAQYEPDVIAARGMLKSFASSSVAVSDILLLHPRTGEVMISSDDLNAGKIFIKKPCFLSGRYGFSIQKAHYSISKKMPLFSMSVPVRDGTGNTIGVLVTRIALINFTGWLNRNAEADGIRTYLANRPGIFIFGQEDSGGIRLATHHHSAPAIIASKEKPGYRVFREAGEAPTVGAYTFIAPLQLAVVSESSLDSVLKDFNKKATTVIMMTLAFCALLLYASLMAAGRITGFLSMVAEMTDDIASGSYGHTLPVHHTREAQELCQSMNRMAGALNDRENQHTEIINALNTLIDHMPEGIALLDQNGKVLLSNKLMEEPLLLMADQNSRGEILAIAGNPLGSYISASEELKWSTTPGIIQDDTDGTSTHRIFEVAARSIMSKTGNLAGFVLSIKDITDEKRFRELAQNQEKMAAVGQLASGIAHDFNNILTSIIGFSELLLLDADLSEDVRKQVEAINSSGNRASDLISQIMDFSRKSVSTPKVLELKEEVASFIRFISRLIPESISMRIEAEPGRLSIAVDPTKLQQVLTNLTLNARDAMPKGGIIGFKLSTLRHREGQPPPVTSMEPGRWVLIAVSDTGEGISDDVLPHVFEPFYTTKAAANGTGLGLAQVYGIVKQHGGHISVKSGNDGTTFSIYFPEGQEEAEQAPPAAEVKQKIHGHGETILVVEDDQAIMDLITSVLKGRGYQVLQAINGVDGLDTFLKHIGNVDLVLTDMIMPGLNGYEMSLKIHQADPQVRVLTISGYAPGAITGLDEASLINAGIIKWIPKPFEPSMLIKEIDLALADKKQD